MRIFNLGYKYFHGEIGTFKEFKESDWKIIVPILEQLQTKKWQKVVEKLDG